MIQVREQVEVPEASDTLQGIVEDITIKNSGVLREFYTIN